MKRTILTTFLLLALVGGGYWAWRSHQKQRENALVLYGNIDIREVNLAFRVSGRIKEVLKDEGDPVKPGELVATLDAEPYRREMQEAEAQAASLRAKVQMVEAGYRKEDIQQAEANVTEGEAVLANAQRTLLRKQDLVAKKVGPQQESDDAVGARDEAQARLNSYRAALAMQQAGYRPEEIAQARADLAKAEAALASAQLRVTDTELKAPAKGIVMTRALEPGAIVEMGSTILSVSLTDPVWARAYVAEDHLGQVHPGTKMLVYTDTRPDKPYSGQIGYVSPQAEFTPKSVETPELRPSLVYRIRIIISDPDEDLRQGMPVTARLPGNNK
jgi:HlyD family secretion protein